MRKITLALVLINFCTITYSQIIKGTIQDLSTNNPINFAAIYFNGTFVGTHSDQNGNFEIDISKNKSMPLIISALGYYSNAVPDLSSGKYYRIYLKPKIFELNDVVISTKGNAKIRRERKANIKIFREVFIGKTSNAQKCEIINENDLMFKYSSFGDTITAFSLKPLLIENKALGYKISYYLDMFEYSAQTDYFYFYGNIMFLEDSITREKRTQRFEGRREIAFLGSRMHFFRTLWENDLDLSGYSVLDNKKNKLCYDDLVIQTDSLSKYLKNKGSLEISYSKKIPVTHIIFTQDSVYFNKNGIFDGIGLRWDGEMANQRIADQLPYEYSFKKNNR
ncbi:MAG: carboxypeptidase-like regulatory domain-containing protein [Bacteroidia bacterium]|nr:carboxypeptidase-like regulatory domain-containing protein [Bacteroidia bacterium]